MRYYVPGKSLKPCLLWCRRVDRSILYASPNSKLVYSCFGEVGEAPGRNGANESDGLTGLIMFKGEAVYLGPYFLTLLCVCMYVCMYIYMYSTSDSEFIAQYLVEPRS